MVVYPFSAGAALFYSLVAQILFRVSGGAQVEVPNRSMNPKCERVKTCLVSVAHDLFGVCNVTFREGGFKNLAFQMLASLVRLGSGKAAFQALRLTKSRILSTTSYLGVDHPWRSINTWTQCSCFKTSSLIQSCDILAYSSRTISSISATVVGCLKHLCNTCFILLQHFSIGLIFGLIEG